LIESDESLGFEIYLLTETTQLKLERVAARCHLGPEE
jgi:hypothetical protein